MMSPAERLVYMANQIARNFAAQGVDVAALAVADHIAAFWDPRMKAQIFAMESPALEPIAARSRRAATAIGRDSIRIARGVGRLRRRLSALARARARLLCFRA